MTLSDMASIASVVSGLAVLGSLIYLGLQTIRIQNIPAP